MKSAIPQQRKKSDGSLRLLLIAVGLFGALLAVLAFSTANAKKLNARTAETASAAVQATLVQSILIQSAASTPTAATPAGIAEPTVLITPAAEPSLPQPAAVSAAGLDPADWKNWPVIPESVSQKMVDIYRSGIEQGNDPTAFSKVGDSNSVLPSFLACFDYGAQGYAIGNYSDLEAAIRQFQWSFSRESRATKIGITAFDLDVYHWYEDDVCWPYESATSCEYRLWKPSIAFIALGTNDAYMEIGIFEEHLRSLVQKTLDRAIVPILVTKADNLEGDDSYNAVIARLAAEYEVPLWNLWRAMDPLPNHGLREQDVHPTSNDTSLCDFTGDDIQKYGWTVRNLTGLQALDRVWRLLNQS